MTPARGAVWPLHVKTGPQKLISDLPLGLNHPKVTPFHSSLGLIGMLSTVTERGEWIDPEKHTHGLL